MGTGTSREALKAQTPLRAVEKVRTAYWIRPSFDVSRRWIRPVEWFGGHETRDPLPCDARLHHHHQSVHHHLHQDRLASHLIAKRVSPVAERLAAGSTIIAPTTMDPIGRGNWLSCSPLSEQSPSRAPAAWPWTKDASVRYRPSHRGCSRNTPRTQHDQLVTCRPRVASASCRRRRDA